MEHTILRNDFKLPQNENEKQELINKVSVKYGEFLDTLGIDWKSKEHFTGTPNRVAKMYINEIWSGIYNKEPDVRSFKNTQKYDGMVYSGGIDIKSTCAHHAIPFFGICHIAYLPSPKGYIVGLSKLNRIAEFYARRPNTQEDLTMEIHQHIDKVCKDNLGVAITISCKHLCCQLRGVNQASEMKTSKMSGEFLSDKSLSRQEFYNFIRDWKQ